MHLHTQPVYYNMQIHLLCVSMCIVYTDDIDCFKFCSIFHHQNCTSEDQLRAGTVCGVLPELDVRPWTSEDVGLGTWKEIGSVSKPCTPREHKNSWDLWM